VLSRFHLALSLRRPLQCYHKFYAVDVESPHNAILGRPWLHIMKVVPSTYHHLVQYPTPTGMIDIRGDQAAATTISTVAQKKSGWRSKIARATLEEILPEEKKLKLIDVE